MNTSLYETIKTFELRTDLNTKVVTEVSARDNGVRRSYRVGTFRVYDAHDGTERKSPWLGTRELMLKQGLEKAAVEFILQEEMKRKAEVDAAA